MSRSFLKFHLKLARVSVKATNDNHQQRKEQQAAASESVYSATGLESKKISVLGFQTVWLIFPKLQV